MPSTSRSSASGSRAANVARDRRRAHAVVARPTRASPARARRPARSPTAGRGTRARARATGRRRGTTRPARAHTPRRVAGSPVGGGGSLPHRSSPRAARRGADARDAHQRAARRAAARDAVRRRHRADERDARHAFRRDRGERERVRAARRPADDREPLDVERGARAAPPTRAASRRMRGAAAVDREQAHAERRRDRVVRVTREPRVAAAVQVDDRRASRVADVVDRQRATTSVARMPSARWFATEHQNEYRPGASFTVSSARLPGRRRRSPRCAAHRSRCTRRSCASWPKFASSITAGPACDAARESENEYSRADDLDACGRSRPARSRCKSDSAEQRAVKTASFT